MGMKRFQRFTLSCLILFVVLFGSHSARAKGFFVSSPQLKDSGTMAVDQILNGFGCTGKNISPELMWKNPPAGTKSFAVTVYDPDAPTGSG
jgi:phosphatidylethanolamine-binding protein (PEBP) family uncharacterized protein